jgi:peptidoglycan/xylan/chitin deacetylase (PgdA/CDA1 family)
VPRILLSCDGAEKWEISNADLLRDQANAAFGGCSFKFTTRGKKEPVVLKRTLAAPVPLDNHVVMAWVRVSDFEGVEEMRLDLRRGGQWEQHFLQGNRITLRMLRREDWSTVSFTPTSDAPITDVQITVRDNGRPVTVWISRISAIPKTIDHGIVSLTFDDAWSSVYTMARPVMDRYHYAGTAYVTTSFVGTDKHMTVGQLLKLQDIHGWDIASHTVTHPDVSKVQPLEIVRELRNSKVWLMNHGFRRGAEHLSFPFGGFDNEEVARQVRYLYRSARLIDGPMETLPVADPKRLRVFLVINTTRVDEVVAKIDEALRNRDWLILVFHRIEPAGAPLQFDTQYSQTAFQQIIDALARKNATVLPVSQVIHESGLDY